MALKLDALKIDGRVQRSSESGSLLRLRDYLCSFPDEEFLTAGALAIKGGFSLTTVLRYRETLIAEGLCQPAGDKRGRILHGNKRSIAALKTLQRGQT